MFFFSFLCGMCIDVLCDKVWSHFCCPVWLHCRVKMIYIITKIRNLDWVFSWLQVVVEYDEESDYTDYFIEIADKVGMFKQTEANCNLFPVMNLKHVLNSVNHIRT